MILAALALALQPPSYLSDPAFVPAYTSWIRCTHRAMDGTDASGRSDEEIVATAHAGCAAEEAAVRAAIVAASGEVRGARHMNEFRAADRQALLERARARRAAGEQDALTRAWVRCVLGRVEAAAAETPEGQVVAAALDGCGPEQEAMRRWATTQGGAGRAGRFIREVRDMYRQNALEHLRRRRARPAPAGD